MIELMPLGEMPDGGYKQYEISASYEEIVSELGEPNMGASGDGKSEAQWGFSAILVKARGCAIDLKGKHLGYFWVWSYKTAPEDCVKWSAYGSLDALAEIFGNRVSRYKISLTG